MIEKIALPTHARMFCRIAFPALNDILHSSVWAKAGEKMNVIRHQEKQVRVPFVSMLIEPRGLEKDVRDCRSTKLILAFRLTTDCDKKDGIRCSDEMRRIVR